MAVGVRLFALYRWTAHGDYAALGVVGGILFAAAAVLIAVTMIQARSLGPCGVKVRQAAGTTDAAWDTANARCRCKRDHNAFRTYSWTSPTTAAFPVASASDLVEPLGYTSCRKS
jgi:hypothetical protein